MKPLKSNYKTNYIGIKATDDERRKLEELARHYHCSMSQVLISYIVEAHDNMRPRAPVSK